MLQQLLNPERHLLVLLAHMGLVAREGLVNPGIVILVWAVKKGVGIRQAHLSLSPGPGSSPCLLLATSLEAAVPGLMLLMSSLQSHL